VLPRSARLTKPEDFARTTKSGFRITSKALVGYLYLTKTEATGPKCGLIISKSVGGSVQRHRIARQIRHTVFNSLNQLPQNALLVIRALPTAHPKTVVAETEFLISKLLSKTLAQQ